MRVRKLKKPDRRVLEPTRYQGLKGTQLVVVSVLAILVLMGLSSAVTVDIAPDALNLGSQGNYVTAYVEPSVFLKENFEDGIADGFVPVAGTWTVLDDSGNMVYDGTATLDESISCALSSELQDDVVFEARLKAINNVGHYGIVLRDTGDGSGHYGFYLAALSGYEGKYYFGWWNGADYETIVYWIDSGGAYTDAHVWNSLKVVANGYTFGLYINGVLVNTVEDTAHHASSGYVGLIVDYNGGYQNTYFDDLLLTDIDVTSIDVSSVKLWHSWSDDFSDSAWTEANWREIGTGAWEAASGVYSGTGGDVAWGRDVALAGAMVAPVLRSDLILNVRVRNDQFATSVTPNQGACIPIRYDPMMDTFALVVFFPDKIQFQISTGNAWQAVTEAPYDDPYGWHDLRIVAQGDNYDVYLDNTLKITASYDANDLGQQMGLWAYWGGGKATFDDFSVMTFIANAMSAPSTIGDYDSDGVSDLMVKFDRATVCAYLTKAKITSGYVELSITGECMDGSSFSGMDSVKVISKGKVKL